ncbi:hypothetical protein KUTeg_009890 [Tegillarca granosa]|uniref:PiggyBac transposable element-derived protein 4 C-terminal zinc-finger domain-containing protein n=1 Tax=Tegillarca granosa TaxID=220873 RepID=A0ABQ9F564_TEGGR|nr:hypothetical protein KUTeg_009890 [Tegillarca granosa]
MREVALVNGYILFCKDLAENQKKPVPRLFREQVIQSLLEDAANNQVIGTQDPSLHRGEKVNPARLTGRHFIRMYENPKNKLDCEVCNDRKKQGWKRKQTRFFCKTCRVPLCVEPCFEIYHTVQNYKKYAGLYTSKIACTGFALRLGDICNSIPLQSLEQLELTKVTKLLIAVDKGQAHKLAGKKLSEMQLDVIKDNYNDLKEGQDLTLNKMQGAFAVVVSQNEDHKRVWDCRNAYLFCDALQTNLNRHLFRKHKNEVEVVKIVSYPKNLLERKNLLEKLRHLGNFYHNAKVKELGKEMVLVAKRPAKGKKISYKSFLPCVFCKGYYLGRDIWRHYQTCRFKDSLTVDDEECKKIQQFGNLGASRVLAEAVQFNNSAVQKEQVFGSMRKDNVTVACKNDLIISTLGMNLLMKCGLDQINYIRANMREMGRLLLQVREKCGNAELTLEWILSPGKFDSIFDAVYAECKYALLTDVCYSLIVHVYKKMKRKPKAKMVETPAVADAVAMSYNSFHVILTPEIVSYNSFHDQQKENDTVPVEQTAEDCNCPNCPYLKRMCYGKHMDMITQLPAKPVQQGKVGIYTEEAAAKKMEALLPVSSVFLPVQVKTIIFNSAGSRTDLAAKLLIIFYSKDEMKKTQSLSDLKDGRVIIEAIIACCLHLKSELLKETTPQKIKKAISNAMDYDKRYTYIYNATENQKGYF